MNPSLLELQSQTSRAHGAAFDPPTPGLKVGVAVQTMGRLPVHGVRSPPTETTCGWYISAGDEYSNAEGFYQPLCVEHLETRCPVALPYLALPPGWGFMVDGLGFVDVWYVEEHSPPATMPPGGGRDASAHDRRSPGPAAATH